MYKVPNLVQFSAGIRELRLPMEQQEALNIFMKRFNQLLFIVMSDPAMSCFSMILYPKLLISTWEISPPILQLDCIQQESWALLVIMLQSKLFSFIFFSFLAQKSIPICIHPLKVICSLHPGMP